MNPVLQQRLSADREPLLAVERAVLEFHKIDATGQEFRYSKLKSGKDSLSSVPKTIDLLVLRDVMDGVYNFLDGCGGQIDAAVDAMGLNGE
jgi:hypothetical protein